MDLSRKRILVVDSDPIVLALVTHILERQGYHVRPHSGPAEAIAAARTAVFDGAVIEMTASGDGGWLARLFDSAPSLAGRVIITGADVRDGVPIHERLERPIELRALIAAVARCVRTAD
ncbi:MAG TPA: hypothetical protein VKH35_02975 [Thermoanaerobaculia bacterium]|nr:hypothetical protein [Thermoanaerobaculia bacterium]